MRERGGLTDDASGMADSPSVAGHDALISGPGSTSRFGSQTRPARFDTGSVDVMEADAAAGLTILLGWSPDHQPGSPLRPGWRLRRDVFQRTASELRLADIPRSASTSPSASSRLQETPRHCGASDVDDAALRAQLATSLRLGFPQFIDGCADSDLLEETCAKKPSDASGKDVPSVTTASSGIFSGFVRRLWPGTWFSSSPAIATAVADITMETISAALNADAYQELISGSMVLKGSELTGNPAVICDALRQGLLKVVEHIVQDLFVVVSYPQSGDLAASGPNACQWKAAEGRKGEKSRTRRYGEPEGEGLFRFDVKVMDPFEKALVIEALALEADCAGARRLLPALVCMEESLGGVGRLAVRLEVVNECAFEETLGWEEDDFSLETTSELRAMENLTL